MLKQEKIEYMNTWMKENKLFLMGNDVIPGGVNTAASLSSMKFISGFFYSLSTAKRAVPYLQHVFQVDACHVNFGSYTMYTAYGISANCNTFLII